MTAIAHVVLSRPTAIAFARETDGRTAADVSYVVKGALARFLGEEHGIRPYRIVEEDDLIRVVGFAAPDAVRQPQKDAKSVVESVEFMPWTVAKGAEIFLDILACPMASVGPKKGDGRNSEVDVARAPGVTDPLAAYSAWFAATLGKPDTGCVPLGATRFASVGHFDAIRKLNGAKSANCPRCRRESRTTFLGACRWRCESCSIEFENARKVRMPRVHAMAKVRVVNPPAFDRFLRTGIGRQKAFGYGSMMPTDVLDELEL